MCHGKTIVTIVQDRKQLKTIDLKIAKIQLYLFVNKYLSSFLDRHKNL